MAIVLVAAVILAALPLAPALQTRYPASLSALGITLRIDFGNGTTVTFNGLNGTTVLNVTDSVVDVETNWAGELAYVVSIDGVSQDQNHWWQYWVNGNYATVAANWYSLQDGDSVLWNRTVFGSQNTTSTDIDSTLIAGGILLGAGGLGFMLLLYIRTSRRGTAR